MGFRQGTTLGLILYFPGNHLCRPFNPKLGPCGTPASTLSTEKCCLFETIRSFLSFEKSIKVLRKYFLTSR